MQWHIRKKLKYLILLPLLAFFAGCERVVVDPDPSRSGYNYFPLEVGAFRTYEIYRINYNFSTENDTSRYRLKELVADKFLNQEGDTSYVLHRLVWQEGKEIWQLDSVVHLRPTPIQLVEMSNNKPLVKLVFPIQEGKTWNSNHLNASPADSFRMIDVNRPYQLDDSLFDRTLTVLQRNIQDTIVRQDIRREVYAQNSGLIYQLVKTFNYCATEECIGKGIINSGIFLEKKLKNHGKE